MLSRNPHLPGARSAWEPGGARRPPPRSSGRDAVSTSRARTSPSAGRRRQAPHPRVARTRHAQPRRRHRGAPSPRPRVLVSASAVGYYGPHGDERLDEDTPAGRRLPRRGVRRLGARGAARPRSSACASCTIRTGVVLDPGGGALAKMLPPFKLGVGGPVAGGAQYMPWIHVDDVVGMYLAALDDDALAGPDQRQRARAGHQQGVLQGAGARAAPPGVRARPRLRDAGALRRDGGDRDQGPARGPDGARSSTATRSRTPTSTRR